MVLRDPMETDRFAYLALFEKSASHENPDSGFYFSLRLFTAAP